MKAKKPPTAIPSILRIQWLRLVSEGLAIVTSILLALAVDAWWDRRQERDTEEQLLMALQADFTQNQNRIQKQIKLEYRLANAISTFLDHLANAQQGEPVAVADTLIAATLPSPTYDPVTTSLDAALSAGSLELIQSERVREELANWQSVANDTRQDELAVRTIVNDLLVPELGREVRLAHAYENVVDWSIGNPEAQNRLAGSQTIRVSLALENAIATQLFNKRFVLSGLEEMAEIQTELLEVIGSELE